MLSLRSLIYLWYTLVLTTLPFTLSQTSLFWRKLMHPCFWNGRTWARRLTSLSTFAVTLGGDHRTGTQRPRLRGAKRDWSAQIDLSNGWQRDDERGSLVAAGISRRRLSRRDSEVAWSTCCFSASWKACDGIISCAAIIGHSDGWATQCDEYSANGTRSATTRIDCSCTAQEIAGYLKVWW